MYEIFIANSLERPALYYGQRRSDPWVVVLKSFYCIMLFNRLQADFCKEVLIWH